MPRLATISLLILLSGGMWLSGCSRCSDAPAPTPGPVADDEVVPDRSFEGINAWQTDQETMGDLVKPLMMRTVKPNMEKTPGTLPQGKTEVMPGDFSIRSLVYGTVAPEDVDRIHGFMIARQFPPQKIEGFAPKPLRRIRVTLEYGPVGRVNFGDNPIPKIPEQAPEIRDSEVDELEPETAPTADETKPAPTAPGKQGEDGLTIVFERDFLLAPQRDKSHYWEFDKPYPVSIKRGDGIQITIEYLVPELDPTQSIINTDAVILAVPDRYREEMTIRALSPVLEKRRSACFGSATGQLVCMYSSGMVEMYVEAPFEKPAIYGSWSASENIVTITTRDKTYHIDTSAEMPNYDFGVWGSGFAPILEGDDRLHPYYDVTRGVGTPEVPFSPEKIVHVYLAQVARGGPDEAVAEFKDGGFAVFERADDFSPWRLIKQVEGANNRLLVVFQPLTRRAFVAVKSEGDSQWKVFAYSQNTGAWTTFPRTEVPWKPWEKQPVETPKPKHHVVPHDENDSPTPPENAGDGGEKPADPAPTAP